MEIQVSGKRLTKRKRKQLNLHQVNAKEKTLFQASSTNFTADYCLQKIKYSFIYVNASYFFAKVTFIALSNLSASFPQDSDQTAYTDA